jgi:Fe-S-cluster containining protein
MSLNEQLAQLKQEWFARFDKLLANKTLPSSNLKCLELCEARCCPRAGMRAMQPEQIASPIVVLLPFEMEYIIEKTGTSRDAFRIWPIDLTPDLRLEIGSLDLGKPCPFLQEDRLCGIHSHNPLDCRTFPLLPSLNPAGQLEWSLGEHCPSLAFLNPAFSEHMQGVWRDLEPFIPCSWWDLYAFADHWTGFPQPSEPAHAD